jgi:hypothetical protein
VETARSTSVTACATVATTPAIVAAAATGGMKAEMMPNRMPAAVARVATSCAVSFAPASTARPMPLP